MKNLFRFTVFALFVGGWALAAASLHVVRTPTKFIVIPKDVIGYKDTYVDTRAWTLADDSAHPEVVNRLVHLGKADALAHTVNSNSGPVEAQLVLAVHQAGPAPAAASLTDQATTKFKNAVDVVKSKI